MEGKRGGIKKAAVIPHSKVQPFIYDNARDELHARHKNDASYDLPPERILPSYHPALHGKILSEIKAWWESM